MSVYVCIVTRIIYFEKDEQNENFPLPLLRLTKILKPREIRMYIIHHISCACVYVYGVCTC